MLSETAILDRIADVIRDYNSATGKTIRSTHLSADDHFCDDLGGESMDLIAIALALEDAFGIAIDEEELVDADPWSSVDTSKPAICGRGKTGHRGGRSSEGVVARWLGRAQAAFFGSTPVAAPSEIVAL